MFISHSQDCQCRSGDSRDTFCPCGNRRIQVASTLFCLLRSGIHDLCQRTQRAPPLRTSRWSELSLAVYLTTKRRRKYLPGIRNDVNEHSTAYSAAELSFVVRKHWEVSKFHHFRKHLGWSTLYKNVTIRNDS